MAFDPVPFVAFFARCATYDGTNSADILAYPWSNAVTLISEEDGVLTLTADSEVHAFNVGDFVIISVAGDMFGGRMSAADFANYYAPFPASP